MRFEGVCELVALFEADLHDIDDTELREELECPVDARALGELAGAKDFLQRQGLVAVFEYRKDIATRFCEAKSMVSEEHFETFHVASIRLVATNLQQERSVRYAFLYMKGHKQ